MSLRTRDGVPPFGFLTLGSRDKFYRDNNSYITPEPPETPIAVTRLLHAVTRRTLRTAPLARPAQVTQLWLGIGMGSPMGGGVSPKGVLVFEIGRHVVAKSQFPTSRDLAFAVQNGFIRSSIVTR
jgi:hypothetical protein